MADTERMAPKEEATHTTSTFRRSTFRVFALCIFYILYLIIGAAVFAAIEGPQEESVVGHIRDVREEFLRLHSSCLSDESLEQLIKEVVLAANRGVSAVRNASQSDPNWSFGQAMFFASTVVTTIGYGRVTPLSDAGKAFCILFAILGIPLTLVLFSAIVERLMIPARHLLLWLYGRLGHMYKVFHIQLLHLIIILLIHVTFFMIIPAAIYTVLENDWNFLDAFYYCFISLSTIGLGDYIPGDSVDQPHRALYKVATTFYLLIGMTMMFLLVTVFYDIPELNLGFHFYLKSDEKDEKAAAPDEHTRLKSSDNPTGAKYSKQVDDVQSVRSGQYHAYQQDISASEVAEVQEP